MASAVVTGIPTTREGRSRVRPSLFARPSFWIAEAALLAIVVVLAVAVGFNPGPLPGDVAATVALQRWLTPFPTASAVLADFSTFTWPQYSAIMIAAVIVLLLALRRWLDAIMTLALIGVADGATYIFHESMARPRPDGYGVVVADQHIHYFSFPSGHVEHALVFFGFLLFLTFQTRGRAPWLWLARLALLVAIVLMGPSRVFLGEHWPSDVLAGLLFGAQWLLAGIAAYAPAASRWPRLLGTREGTPPGDDPRVAR